MLVVGLGPAGFTVAHHLMNDGHAVVGIDGLKIEPLEAAVSGVDPLGNRVGFKPIKDISELREPLDRRAMAGFGGVAEYGITVRWDKNFLKIIRLLLERRRQFAMFGGVRFGGTLTIDEAFADGFDHIALCAGAGRPTVLEIPNGFARGVRAASDFLMALQLTGAAKRESIANLQIRLPIVVIGGGLTAIDTATESLAYYAVQVEKFLARYEALDSKPAWNAEEREIAEEFIAHAKALRSAGPERRLQLLKSLGRRHHRLSAPHDRQPLLHPQPRGSRQGARGRHRLRRRADADAHRGRQVRARQRRDLPGRHPAARALGSDRRRHAAQYRACARGRRRAWSSTASTSWPPTKPARRSSPSATPPSRSARRCCCIAIPTVAS